MKIKAQILLIQYCKNLFNLNNKIVTIIRIIHNILKMRNLTTAYISNNIHFNNLNKNKMNLKKGYLY